MTAKSKEQAIKYLGKNSSLGAYEKDVETLTALLDTVKRETIENIYLPKITDEMLEDYIGSGLLTWESGAPQWSQTAVDFACLLKSNCLAVVENEK